MKEIIDSINKNNIKILYKEPQFETKLVKNLSSEYNLKVLTLDPL
jgi:ABC-type Zn uptake system ZnuABC Zn-binding protein ZnuA